MVALAGFPAHLYYVGVSAGLPGVQSSFVEIPDASSRGISRRLRDFARAPHRDTVVSDTSNIVLAKFEATYLTPSRQQYPARDFFTHGNLDVERISRWYADIVKPGRHDEIVRDIQATRSEFLGRPSDSLDMKPPVTGFVKTRRGLGPCTVGRPSHFVTLTASRQRLLPWRCRS